MQVRFSILLCLLCSACASTPPARHAPAADAGASNDVVGYAKSLTGTRYHYGGDSPATGFDCSGFVRHVYGHTLGISLPHNARSISQHGKSVPASQLRPGDLVFYNTLHASYSHVGIYVGGQRFIHAPSSGKSVEIVDMNMDYWRGRYNGARRLVKEYR